MEVENHIMINLSDEEEEEQQSLKAEEIIELGSPFPTVIAAEVEFVTIQGPIQQEETLVAKNTVPSMEQNKSDEIPIIEKSVLSKAQVVLEEQIQEDEAFVNEDVVLSFEHNVQEKLQKKDVPTSNKVNEDSPSTINAELEKLRIDHTVITKQRGDLMIK